MPDSPTDAAVGAEAAAVDVAALVARLRAAGCVFAEDEAALLIAEAGSSGQLDTMVAQRVTGLPLEQIVGWAEFCGLRIVVDRGVFVPRRRTALLVSEAVALLPGGGGVVLDLCCGSGAIGVAVASALGAGEGSGSVELHAVDVDPVAVRCARHNVEPLGGTVYEGDLDVPLPDRLRGRVDLAVACPPYVPTSSLRLMPPEARDHEPRVALDGGEDGLDVVRRLAVVAAEWLTPGGHLLVESSEPQADATVKLFERCGLLPRVASSDDLGATVVIGRRPA